MGAISSRWVGVNSGSAQAFELGKALLLKFIQFHISVKRET
jgi:hypothetical protein